MIKNVDSMQIWAYLPLSCQNGKIATSNFDNLVTIQFKTWQQLRTNSENHAAKAVLPDL